MKEEKKAIEELQHFDCAYNKEIKTVLNLIETQKAELEPIKKLNIPVETLVAEFERLEDLEDNTVMLKAEIEKKDKIIDLMIDTILKNDDNYWYLFDANKKAIEDYFTKLAEEEK